MAARQQSSHAQTIRHIYSYVWGPILLRSRLRPRKNSSTAPRDALDGPRAQAKPASATPHYG